MNDDDAVLSAYLDGELSPTEHEAVRLKLRDDADLAARYEMLRFASAVVRERFAETARSVEAPTAPPAALSASAVRGLRRRDRMLTWVRRAAPVAAALAVAALFWRFAAGGPEPVDAATIREAAAEALDERGWLEVRATSPFLLLTGDAELGRAVVGPGGRFLLEMKAPDLGRGSPLARLGELAGAPTPSGAPASPVIRMGSDGREMWRYVEGASKAFVIEPDAEVRAAMSRFGPGGGGGFDVARLGWEQLQDVLEIVREGRFDYERTAQIVDGDLVLDMVRIKPKDPKFGRRGGLHEVTVGVDPSGAIRRVDLPWARLALRPLKHAPDEALFRRETYAPGVETVTETLSRRPASRPRRLR
ncbi:MAG TPA: hypothetical protein VEI02_01455 [Planctomycetota bacterium]|nr:hypothetical protein [Planctomycetota bacterium]